MIGYFYVLLMAVGILPADRSANWRDFETSQRMQIIGDITKEVFVGTIPRPQKRKILSSQADTKAGWELKDSCSFNGRIINKGRFYARIDSGKLYPVLPDTLCSVAAQAVEASPEWIRPALWDNFAMLTPTQQNTYGALILSTPYPYQDELAFEIANLDANILQKYIGDPTIFVDNVKLVYKHDTVLDYVRLVEYSDYTTAKYKIANNGSDTTEIEIPKEIYYWYVVHPAVSHEAPQLVYPYGSAIGGIRYFWRDYLFNYPDTAEKTVWDCYGQGDTIRAGYISPILKNRLSGQKILYNGRIDVINNNGAIGIVSRWVKDVMVFGADPSDAWGGERSPQPVRIYHMHRGRCGEHANFIAAAARSALIPSNCPYDVTRDHTWNEWYDTEWRGWQPYSDYINTTRHYEDDPSWDFRAVFSFRGDGYVWDVTPRYSKSCTLTIVVKDVAGLPVDGAKVSIYTAYFDDPYDSFLVESVKRYTDSDGFAEFLLADSVNFYVNVNGNLRGTYPGPGKLYKVISCAIPGQHYNLVCNLPGHQAAINVSQDTLTDTTKFYKIETNFGVNQEIVHGLSMFPNDIGFYERFENFIDVAKNIEFFICDSANFKTSEANSSFKAFEIGHNVDAGNVSFICPEKKWYVVYSTKDLVENCEVVNINMKLYKYNSAVEENSERNFYLSVSPTPFSSFAFIDFAAPKEEKVSLGIYDLSGRCVKEFIAGKVKAGQQQIKWGGDKITKGVYFIRLNTGDRTITRKIIKL